MIDEDVFLSKKPSANENTSFKVATELPEPVEITTEGTGSEPPPEELVGDQVEPIQPPAETATEPVEPKETVEENWQTNQESGEETTAETGVGAEGQGVHPGMILPSTEPEVEQPAEGFPLETEIKTANVFAKKPIWQRILPWLGGMILIGGLFFLLGKYAAPQVKNLIFKPKEVTLTYWGLWEPESVMQSLIADYQKEKPYVKINYLKQSAQNYRERLQSSLARKEGPDIFRIHNTWVPMLKDDLSSLPPKVMAAADFQKIFYPVATETLSWQNKILGLPLEYDGLALFINEELFAAAGETPPKDWIELRDKANRLTVFDEEGKIKIAGVALGTTNNVDHWSDILGLMILQNGGSLSDPTNEFTRGSLEYYTNFARVDRVWDETLPASTYAFATGKVAMYFGPSWRVFNIQEINRNLKFKVMAMPQLSEDKVNWATFWAEAVAASSSQQEEAWQFLNFLVQKENLQKLYEQERSLRIFGEPYSRAEMADLLKKDPWVGPFLEGASSARSWYLSSRTFDNGLNDKIIKYYEDTVNKVLKGDEAEKSLATAAQGVGQVLGQYGVSK